MFDDASETVFVGIGTLLNAGMPSAHRTIIFSSGVGYGRGRLPRMDETWTVYCVRGPLSAQALGLSTGLAVTDGGVLVRRCFQPAKGTLCRIAVMPHGYTSVTVGSEWEAMCREIGFGYIDARWPVEQVLSAIAQTDLLLTEALHGAITADALRVPWVPVRSSRRILRFKWDDWCASMGLTYEPYETATLWPAHPSDSGFLSRARRTAKRRLIASQLARIAKVARPQLSEARRLEDATQQLEERLEQLKRDVRSGRFNGHVMDA